MWRKREQAMVFPQILGSILYTAGNSCYGRVESGGCWPLFPLQALALSGVGQAVDLGPAFQAAKEKNADNHKTEPLTWIYPIRPPDHLGTVNISDGVQCKVWAPSHHLLSQSAGEQVLTLAKRCPAIWCLFCNRQKSNIYIFKTSENGIQRQNFENLRALYFLKL